MLEGSDVVFQTKIMNEHLICSLCMGYLRDAMTVTGALPPSRGTFVPKPYTTN